MRFLQRPRPNRHIVVVVESTFVIQLWLSPSFDNHIEIFFEPLAQIVEWNAESQRFPFDETMTNTELQPAAAQAIKGRVVLGDAQGIMIGQEQHGSADAHLVRSLRNRSTDDGRGRKNPRERMKMMLSEPNRIEADLLPVSNLINDRPKSFCSFRPRRGER